MSIFSVSLKVKEEKRPWILRAREAAIESSVQVGSKTNSADSQSLPQTLIYIGCGWESFKEVVMQSKQLLLQCHGIFGHMFSGHS